MTTVLGPMPSSYLSQLVGGHKQTYQRTVARQEKELHALEKAQKEALTQLEASFRVAAWQAKKVAKDKVTIHGSSIRLYNSMHDHVSLRNTI